MRDATAQWLSERLGQPFNVEKAAVRSPPDGYTLLQVSVVNARNATLYDNLTFNFRFADARAE
jgi:hypothetical protein